MTRSAESLMPLSRCVLALAKLIRLVKAEKRPVLSGVWCVVVWCRVVVCPENTRKRDKNGEQKRWKHGDNSVGKYKNGKTQWGHYQNTDSSSGTIWSTMDQKSVGKRPFSPTHCLFTLPLGFTDVFDQRVLFQKSKNCLSGPEVLIQRSKSCVGKGPYQQNTQ